MTDESLNPNEQEADAARSSLVDAIHAAENGIAPVKARENAQERQAQVQADIASSAAQEAESARVALQAALLAAETAAAEAAAARTDTASAAEPEPAVADEGAAEVAVAEVAVAEAASEPEAETIAQLPVEVQMTEDDVIAQLPVEVQITEAETAMTDVPEVALDAIVAEEPAHEEPASSDSQHEGIDQMIESLDETPTSGEPVAEPDVPDLEEAAPEADAAAEATKPDEGEVQPAEQVATPAIVMPEEKSAINVALWPFLVYLGAWIAFAGVYIWRFIDVPAQQAVFDQADYGIFVAVAIVLAVTGPVVALATWMTSWGNQGATKGDLLVSALVRGSIVTFGGVSIWWLAYILVDLLRLGRVL